MELEKKRSVLTGAGIVYVGPEEKLALIERGKETDSGHDDLHTRRFFGEGVLGWGEREGRWRSWGRICTKIHAVCGALGNLVRFICKYWFPDYQKSWPFQRGGLVKVYVLD